MTVAQMEFEFLTENVQDAIIDWEDPIQENDLVKLFRSVEEAKMSFLKKLVEDFEDSEKFRYT